MARPTKRFRTKPSTETTQPKPQFELCRRRGYQPGAFNVKVGCRLRRGHAGPCDYAWDRR